jgi:hypothetical protein
MPRRRQTDHQAKNLNMRDEAGNRKQVRKTERYKELTLVGKCFKMDSNSHLDAP